MLVAIAVDFTSLCVCFGVNFCMRVYGYVYAKAHIDQYIKNRGAVAFEGLAVLWPCLLECCLLSSAGWAGVSVYCALPAIQAHNRH